MEELRIYKDRPILEITRPILEKLIKYRELEIKVPCERKIIDHVFDTFHLLNILSKRIKCDVCFDDKKYKFFSRPVFDNYLLVYLDNKEKYKKIGDATCYDESLIVCRGTKKKIAVSLKKHVKKKKIIKGKIYTEREELKQLLIKKGLLSTPKIKNKIGFIYAGPFSLRFYPLYPLEHLSFSKTINLNKRIWDFFAKPIYVYNRGMELGLAFDIIAKKRTLNEILDMAYKEKPKQRDKMAKMLKESMTKVYILVDAFLKGIDWKFICKKPDVSWWRASHRYHRLYLANISKGLFHLRNDLDSEALENLIKSFNEEYVKDLKFYVSKKDFKKAFEREERKKIERKKNINI